MAQTTFGNDDNIPDMEFFENELPREVSENDYKKYYRHAYMYLSSLDDGETARKSDFIDSIPSDVSDDTKWKKGRHILAISSKFGKLIADGFPGGMEIVAIGAKRLDINPGEIPAKEINRVQSECEKFMREFRIQHADEFLTEYQKQAEKDIETNINSSDKISTDRYSAIQNKFRTLIVEEYREELKSLDQSITSSGGSANEELAKSVLEDAGLQEGTGFKNVSRKGWDITVQYSGNSSDSTISEANSLHVEVKSTGLRERAVKGLSDTDDPTILFGFFDDLEEIRGKAEELKKRSLVVYLPPNKFDEADDDGPLRKMTSELENKEYTFFRPNTRFGSDMYRFYNDGRIPE